MFIRKCNAFLHATYSYTNRCAQDRKSSMKINFILLFLLLSFVKTFGQNQYKAELNKLFSESIQKENLTENYIHPWRSNNTNNQYYNSDTIKVFQFKTRSYRMDFCETIEWNFSAENELVLTRNHFCEEPPTRDISKLTDSLKLKLIENKIEFNHNGKLIDEFELLGINKNETKTELILKRIKK